MKIQLTLHRSGKVAVKPGNYLGDVFWDFKEACEAAGVRAKKEGGQWINLASFESLATLLPALEELGLEPQIHPKVTSALQAQAAAANSDKEAASKRLKDITEELAKVGRYPFPYQVEDIEIMSQKIAVLNANPMGSGKTMEALLSISKGAKVLVICPAIVKGNWKRETQKWRLENPTIEILSGRQKELTLTADFTILNYSILPPLEWIQENWRNLVKSLDGQCVIIIDECHMLKNSKAQRTQKCKELCQVLISADVQGRAYLLTGTPLMNRAMELWKLLGLVNLEKEAFGSWGRFTALYNAYKGEYAWEWGDPVQPEVSECLKRVMIRRNKEDILPQLPDKRVHYVPISNVNKKALKGIDWAEIERKLQNEELEFEGLSEARAALATSKIPAMLEYIAEFEEAEEPLVVVSAHRSPIDLLRERPGWEIITGSTNNSERTRIVERFQDGVLDGIGLTIKAGGVGITLTRASHMLFVDEEWTPALNEQCRDRIHRIGQKNTCMYHILVADHPVDTRVAELLAEKHKLVYGTIDYTGKKVAQDGYKQKTDQLQQVMEKTKTLRTLQESDIKKPTRTGADTEEKRDLIAFIERLQGVYYQEFHGSLLRQLEDNGGLTPKQWGCLWKTLSEYTRAESPVEIWAYNGLATLCNADQDRARFQNNVGFNKLDSTIGHNLWDQVQAVGLTKKQWSFMIEMLKKYHRQIGECP